MHGPIAGPPTGTHSTASGASHARKLWFHATLSADSTGLSQSLVSIVPVWKSRPTPPSDVQSASAIAMFVGSATLQALSFGSCSTTSHEYPQLHEHVVSPS